MLSTKNQKQFTLTAKTKTKLFNKEVNVYLAEYFVK